MSNQSTAPDNRIHRLQLLVAPRLASAFEQVDHLQRLALSLDASHPLWHDLASIHHRLSTALQDLAIVIAEERLTELHGAPGAPAHDNQTPLTTPALSPAPQPPRNELFEEPCNPNP